MPAIRSSHRPDHERRHQRPLRYPLAIVTKKGTGIDAGKIGDLKGKKVGLASGQTSDEYFKMVLRRAGVKYEDVTIENIWSQFGLAPALKEGKVDAIVTWEPFVTQALTQVPDSYEVIRGGQHMSYVMVAVAHGPTVEAKPARDQEHRRRAGAVVALHAQ